MKRTALVTSLLALGLATALSACSKDEQPTEDVVIVEPAMSDDAMADQSTDMSSDTTSDMQVNTSADSSADSNMGTVELSSDTMEADMIANDGEYTTAEEVVVEPGEKDMSQVSGNQASDMLNEGM